MKLGAEPMFNSVALGVGVAVRCSVLLHPPPTPYQSGPVDLALQSEPPELPGHRLLILSFQYACASGKGTSAGRFLRPLRNYELQSGALGNESGKCCWDINP
jgi:hypothetical protein